MKPLETYNEIIRLISILVECSLSNDQNSPSTEGKPKRKFKITLKDADVFSFAIKNIPYEQIYAELVGKRCFHVKLIDGSLLGFRYIFEDKELKEHCLTYFPSPDLEPFQVEPEIYLEDEVYGEIVGRHVVRFPVRFDYNADEDRHVEVYHPYSHLSLGQYKNCRIPVCSPVGPYVFTGFILRNFYDTSEFKYSELIPNSGVRFDKTITCAEQLVPHLIVAT